MVGPRVRSPGPGGGGGDPGSRPDLGGARATRWSPSARSCGGRASGRPWSRPPRRWSGFAGILGGAPVLGMAHRLLPAIGVAVDAAAVGLHYGSRASGGVLDVWAMDTADAGSADRLRAAGLRPVVTDLIMTRPGGDRGVRRVRGQVGRATGMITIFAPDGIGEVDPGHRSGRGAARRRPGRPGRAVGRRRHRGGHVQDLSKAEGRVAGRPGPSVRDPYGDGPHGRAPGRHLDRPHPAGSDPGRGRGGRSNVATRTDLAAARGSGRQCPRPCATRCSSGPGCRLGVIVSDTAGRAWRVGQTDHAIGAAGVLVRRSYAGRAGCRTATSSGHRDGRWPTNWRPRPTWPRASSAGRPVAVVRGLAHLVVDSGRRRRRPGPTARARTCSPRQRRVGAGRGAGRRRPAGALRGTGRSWTAAERSDGR